MDNRAGEGYRAVINLDDAYIYNLEQGFSCVSTFFYYSQTRKLEAFGKKLREKRNSLFIITYFFFTALHFCIWACVPCCHGIFLFPFPHFGITNFAM